MKRILRLPNEDMVAASLFKFLMHFLLQLKNPFLWNYHCPLMVIELWGKAEE